MSIALVLGLLISTSVAVEGDFEDNEFAEFEEEGNAPLDVEASVSDG